MPTPARRLAFRILGGNEERAKELAAANTDLLQATLFRPLHRRTRLMAFRAIDKSFVIMQRHRTFSLLLQISMVQGTVLRVSP